MRQTSLQQAFTCSGIGLHSGKPVHMTLSPAPANTGIVFVVATAEGVERILPRPDAVMATALATTLGNGRVHVSTVEHVLAAVRGLGIDNIEIHISGSEIPILDGSAAFFVREVERVGLMRYNSPRRVLRLKRHVEFRDGNKIIHAQPVSTPGAFYVNYAIDFPHPRIGCQRFSLDVTPARFAQVASARTFGFLHEVEALRQNGLALGGSLDNAVVLDDKNVLNTEGLRYPDEFVRHKLLDFIGDMAMASLPLEGAFTVSCSGHQFNNQFLRKLEAEDALVEVALDSSIEKHTTSRPFQPARHKKNGAFAVA